MTYLCNCKQCRAIRKMEKKKGEFKEIVVYAPNKSKYEVEKEELELARKRRKLREVV